MDSRTVKDWLSLYRSYNGEGDFLAKRRVRRSKPQKWVTFLEFLHQQEQAFLGQHWKRS